MLKPESRWRARDDTGESDATDGSPNLPEAHAGARLRARLSRSRSKIASSCSAPASARRSASRFSATISMRSRQKAFEVERVVRDNSRRRRRRALARAGQTVSRNRSGSRRDGALRPARTEVLDVVEAGIGGKNVTTTIEGRQRFPIQVRVAARRARRHRAARRNPRRHAIGQAHSARPAREDQPQHRPERNRQRERAAARLRAGQRAGTRPRRLCARKRSERIAREVETARRHDHRIGAANTKTRSARSARCNHRARRCCVDHFPAALHRLSQREGSGARHPRRALRAHRRRLSAIPARLQFQRRRVGRLHRALRHGDSDRRRHGRLSRGNAREKARPNAARPSLAPT